MFSEELIAGKVAARNAGKILMKYFSDSDKKVKYKSFNNPVTIADHEADQYIADFIGGEFPDDGWLSEETVDTPERLNKSRVWIVDPLDGTKEFIEGVPHFSVSIALVEDGYPVVGVIYNPYTKEMFSAEKIRELLLMVLRLLYLKNKSLMIHLLLLVDRSIKKSFGKLIMTTLV